MKLHHPHNRYERKLLEFAKGERTEEKIKFDNKPKRRTGKIRHARETEEAEELDHELSEVQIP